MTRSLGIILGAAYFHRSILHFGSNLPGEVFRNTWYRYPKTNSHFAPENGPGPKRKRKSIPTIHFQVQFVSFREGMPNQDSKMDSSFHLKRKPKCSLSFARNIVEKKHTRGIHPVEGCSLEIAFDGLNQLIQSSFGNPSNKWTFFSLYGFLYVFLPETIQS